MLKNMKKNLSNSAMLTEDMLCTLSRINDSLKSTGVAPQVIVNPIYGCGSCAMWSSGKGVCEGKAK